MKRGLVLGKFMPLHKGHIELITFAAAQCDKLIVWLCIEDNETMSENLRYSWLKDEFKEFLNIEIIKFNYNEIYLPSSSVADQHISDKWAVAIQSNLGIFDAIFSSEDYGDMVANYLKIEHIRYPQQLDVHATDIREDPHNEWEFIPDTVKPYYLFKVCIAGTESTGKTTLCKKLAVHYESDYVPEVGRFIVENSNTCTPKNLEDIAVTHALMIQQKSRELNKFLFIDTDINITKSYSKFLFNKTLNVKDYNIEDINKTINLYIYLSKDNNYIQDGTRLSENSRNDLDIYHRMEYKHARIVLNHVNKEDFTLGNILDLIEKKRKKFFKNKM